MRTAFKLIFSIFLSTMLLFGCVSTQSETQPSPALENVLVPKGNPETF